MFNCKIFGIIISMKENGSGLLKGFALLLLAAIMGVGSVAIYPVFKREHELKAQVASLKSRIAAKRAEIEKLKEYRHRFGNDMDFMEVLAKRNRRVLPGEYVFIFEK